MIVFIVGQHSIPKELFNIDIVQLLKQIRCANFN